MIDKPTFEQLLKLIGRKFHSQNIQWNKWYEQYEYYESMWLEYFALFNEFLSQQKASNKCIQFVFLGILSWTDAFSTSKLCF